MGSFLKSRRNFILIPLVILILTLLLFQKGISYTVSKSKPKILNYLTRTFGYRFGLQDLSFNFSQGLHLKGASIFYDEQNKPPVLIKDAFVRIKILPLIFKRTIAIRIDINEASLLLNQQREGLNLQIIFSDISKKMPKNKPAALNLFKYSLDASIKTAKLICAGNASFDKNIYLLMKNSRIKQEAERFKFDSDIEFNYLLPKDAYLAHFFKNKVLKEKVRCSLQGNIRGGDLIIDLLLFTLENSQIVGAGINKGFAQRNPNVDIAFMHSAILLDNIASLKDNFDAEGNAFFSLKINGPLDNLKTSISSTLYYCNFRYVLLNAESFNIKKLSADLEYGDNLLKFDKAYLELNGVPLNIKLSALVSNEPEIDLNISLPKDFLISQNLPLEKLEGEFKGKLKKTLQGDLKINALYVRKGLDLNMHASFKNIDFDYSNPKEKYLRADTVELTKDSASKIQKLNFSKLESKIYFGKDSFEFKKINFCGYNTLLNGAIKLHPRDEASLTVLLEGVGLDVKTVMQDINISDKLLSGAMDIKIAFDNQQKDFLSGTCHIEDGAVNLKLLADTLRLPALKKLNFDIIDGRFSISKDKIKVDEIKLTNPDISLDASWQTNTTIDGRINLKIASGLLSQSVPFKKMLDLTQIKKSYIDFSFSLGGIPKTARVMWLKGEFKDRIKQDLPAWVKRKIENNLDKLIDGMDNE